jgi:oligopeptide/dipeptide ABC transporter ATP-binding protein
MNDTRKPLLAIEALHTRFHTQDGVVNAVDGVDFNVYRGETLGLVGESGCGKSVTALSILQLLRCPPAEIQGTIRFEGVNLLNLDSEEIRKIRGSSISMIFQEPMTSLNPVLTIGEQISEAVRLHEGMKYQEAWKWAVNMLQMVQISGPRARAREYPHKFSGGMRQRAMIAMALSCGPSLLIADEPTTALDVTTQAQILDLMRELKDDFGMSIMLITHDLGVVAEMADDVVVMYLGTVVERGTVVEVFHDAHHPYTQALLRSIPKYGLRAAGKRLNSIRGMVPDPYSRPEGCPYHPRCDHMMPGKCDRISPPSFVIGQDRVVRCLLYEGYDVADSEPPSNPNGEL